MMDLGQGFLEAFQPEPVILLNQRLLPFSLGHAMLIERLAPTVATLESDIMEADLFIGVMICCSKYHQALAELESDGLQKKLIRWMTHCKRDPDYDFSILMAEFTVYRIKGSTVPPFRKLTQKRGTRSHTVMPWHLRLFKFLCGHMHFSQEEALNFPYGAAQWVYCAHLEDEGVIALTHTTEEEEMNDIRAKMKEMGMEPIRIQPDPKSKN